ncbi:hypothetical protein [Limosilactobacillus alvi]|nr:hypothetical protein [Limosilactobacillus alvi]
MAVASLTVTPTDSALHGLTNAKPVSRLQIIALEELFPIFIH